MFCLLANQIERDFIIVPADIFNHPILGAQLLADLRGNPNVEVPMAHEFLTPRDYDQLASTLGEQFPRLMTPVFLLTSEMSSATHVLAASPAPNSSSSSVPSSYDSAWLYGRYQALIALIRDQHRPGPPPALGYTCLQDVKHSSLMGPIHDTFLQVIAGKATNPIVQT